MKRCRTAVRLNREADDGGGWYFTPSEGAAKGSKHLISSVWKDPFPEKVHHKNTLVYVSDVTTGGDKGKENRTYRVNSSVNWVWSGGKNFTTNRRMVFLGPEGRNEHLSIHIWCCFDTNSSLRDETHSWQGCISPYDNRKWDPLTSDLFQRRLQQIQPHLERKASWHLSPPASSCFRGWAQSSRSLHRQVN